MDGRLDAALLDTLFDSAVWLQLRWSYARFGSSLAHVHWIDTEAYHVAKAGIRPLILSAWGTDINRLFLDPSDHATAARELGLLCAAQV